MMTMQRKLNVLMVAVCPFPANHGGAASIREMSEVLVKFGHDVHVVTYPIQEDIPIEGVHIHRVNVPFLKPAKVKVGPGIEKFIYDPIMIVKLLYLIRKYNIDVIHAHNYEGAMIGWFGRVLLGRPMLYNAVNSMADELPTYNFIKPKSLAIWLGKVLDSWVPRMGNFVTVVSDALKGFLVSKGVPERLIKVVPAGVNVEMFHDGCGKRVRKQFGVQQAPLVMYTGALEQFQRIDYLLKAMKVVVDKHPDARLLIVASIANEKNLKIYQNLARELGIYRNVIVLSGVPLHELPDHLAAADVAVVPRPECPGHPVKLLNYMAAAKAIVSFEGGAKGLHHMHNGYVVNDHDYEALGEGIVFLLENPDIAKELGDQAFNTIRGNMDWETLARGIEVIYNMMLTGDHDAYRADLDRYIKDSYVFQFVERREVKGGPAVSRRRGPDRRLNRQHIEFLERRRVRFGNSAQAGADNGDDVRMILSDDASSDAAAEAKG